MAVELAQRLAVASEYIRADAIEITEFPDLAQKYAVRGVPKTVINESVFLEGTAPEKRLLEKVLEAVA